MENNNIRLLYFIKKYSFFVLITRKKVRGWLLTSYNTLSTRNIFYYNCETVK